MPYSTPIEQGFNILKLFIDGAEVLSILDISRALGYTGPDAIRNTLKRLNDEGYLIRGEVTRPNGTIKFYYLITPEGEKEFYRLEPDMQLRRVGIIKN